MRYIWLKGRILVRFWLWGFLLPGENLGEIHSTTRQDFGRREFRFSGISQAEISPGSLRRDPAKIPVLISQGGWWMVNLFYCWMFLLFWCYLVGLNLRGTRLFSNDINYSTCRTLVTLSLVADGRCCLCCMLYSLSVSADMQSTRNLQTIQQLHVLPLILHTASIF